MKMNAVRMNVTVPYETYLKMKERGLSPSKLIRDAVENPRDIGFTENTNKHLCNREHTDKPPVTKKEVVENGIS